MNRSNLENSEIRNPRIISGQPKENMPQLPASYTTAGVVTYTPVDILNGIIVRDCNGASRADVLPTAALLVAAMKTPQIGDLIRCRIINGSDAAETITVGVGAGGALDAAQLAASNVIAQNTSKEVTIRITAVSTPAYVAYV